MKAHSPRRRRRVRRVESGAVWAFIPVVALTPLWLVALVAFWLPVQWLLPVRFAWWAGIHLLTSALLFIPVVQRHVFARLLGTRLPTHVEREHLDRAWQVVARSSGVSPDRFVLAVIDEDELNAFACGGHLLVVSSFAVRELPTDELTGVLAHELAHHLGSHTVALTIGQWMSLPIIALARLGWFLQNVAQAATDTFTRRSSGVGRPSRRGGGAVAGTHPRHRGGVHGGSRCRVPGRPNGCRSGVRTRTRPGIATSAHTIHELAAGVTRPTPDGVTSTASHPGRSPRGLPAARPPPVHGPTPRPVISGAHRLESGLDLGHLDHTQAAPHDLTPGVDHEGRRQRHHTEG